MGHPPVNDSNNNPLRSSVCLPSPGRALDGRRRALETARRWSRSNQQWASNCRLSLEASADSRLDDTASTHGDTDFGQETVIPSPFHQKSTNPRKARNRCERGGRGLLWRLGRINRAAPAFLTCPKQEVLAHEMALADRSGDRGTTTLCLGWDWREHCHDTNWAFYGGFASASDFPDFCHQRPATQSRGETARLPNAGACLPARLAIEEDSGFAPRSVRTRLPSKSSRKPLQVQASKMGEEDRHSCCVPLRRQRGRGLVLGQGHVA